MRVIEAGAERKPLIWEIGSYYVGVLASSAPNAEVLQVVMFFNLPAMDENAPLRALKYTPPKEVKERILAKWNEWRAPRVRLLQLSERLPDILSTIPAPPPLPEKQKSTLSVEEVEKELDALYRKLKREVPPICSKCGRLAVLKYRRPTHQEIIERDEGAERGGEYYWECPTGLPGHHLVETPEREEIRRKIERTRERLEEARKRASETPSAYFQRWKVAKAWFDSLSEEQKLAFALAVNNCPEHSVRGRACPNGEVWDNLTQSHILPDVRQLNPLYFAENFATITRERGDS